MLMLRQEVDKKCFALGKGQIMNCYNKGEVDTPAVLIVTMETQLCSVCRSYQAAGGCGDN